MPLFTLLTVNNNHKKHLMKNKKLMLLLCAMTLGAWLCPLHADTGPQKKLTRDAYVIWDPQILEPSQLSSNSDAGSAESSSLSDLIDNDASTVFHSVWHTDMKLADETVEKWLAALVKLQDAYVDTTAVCSLYNAYKEITAREIYEGDLPGDVDDESAIETFNTQLDEARALIDPVSPLKAQVNSAMEMINTGYEEFMSHVILPQPYVWYVIRSGVTSESYPYAVNQPIFLDNVSVGGSLRIGGYEIGNEYQDVYDIWRLVPVESNEPVAEGEEIKPWEQSFAIQSLGTGQYWGKYRGQGTANGPKMESEPTPYHIYFYGNGCFALQQEGVKDPFDRIKADGTDLMICNYPANSGDQQSWKFDEVNLSGDGTTHINWYPATSIAIVTFPWAIADGDLQSYRPDIETYSVNSIITNEGAEGDEPSYTLTLTAKQ